MTSFRPKQLEALKMVSKGKELFVQLPTGYGKSLIFDLIPYISKKAIIIISPLDSIIQEQIKKYQNDAIHISSQLLKALKLNDHSELLRHSDSESDDENNDDFLLREIPKLKSRKFKYLVGHPECFTSDVFKVELSKLHEHISHVAIDEAHCIISWGTSDFRPEYMRLRTLRSFLPKSNFIAITATATADMQKDICGCLMIKNHHTVSYVPDRPNIFLEIKERLPSTGSENALGKSLDAIFVPLIEDLRMTKKEFPKTVIYASLPKCAYGHDLSARMLKTEKGPVAQYHAPQTDTVKKHLVHHFREPDCDTRLLFATEAYSMGTDVPDIRRIIHIGAPSSVESYVQALGRAGRDGQESVATLYVNNQDLAKNREHIDESIRTYCRLNSCRRVFIIKHFGFNTACIEPKHLCCDNCKDTCDCLTCKKYQPILTNPISHSAPDMLPPNARKVCTSMLQFYFAKENSLVITHPVPETITGLSEELIAILVKNFYKYVNKRDIYIDFPHLTMSYLVNIRTILSTVNATLQ